MNIYTESQKIKKVHFIGIGGVNMSALAKHLSLQGYLISGSDISENNTKELKELGIKIYDKHNEKNVIGADAVVYTSAISKNNPELSYAIKNNIPLIKRSELLGQIMDRYKTSIAISGSHGKTTTTAMIANMLICASLAPTIFLGGSDKKFGNYLSGKGDVIVVEACEYQRNFLDLRPKITVVLNIDNDHLDTFCTISETAKAFYEFSKNSISIINTDDKMAKDICSGTTISFAKENTASFMAKNISYNGKGYSFTVYSCGRRLGRIRLNVAGEHNVYNALSVVVVANILKVPFHIVKNSLESFSGVKRRNEFIGKTFGMDFYCDYAHHPKEISTMLSIYNNKNEKYVAIFQPHTYSRTSLLIDEFIKCLKNCSILIIYKTYPAREKYDVKGSAKTLYNKLIKGENTGGKQVYYVSDKQGLENLLQTLSVDIKKAVFIGAGDIYDIAKEIVEKEY